MKTMRALDLTDYLENEYFDHQDSPCYESISCDELYDEETIPARLLDTDPTDDYMERVGDVIHFFYPDVERVQLSEPDDILF